MFGLLVDVPRCTGCEECVLACLDVNQIDRKKAEVDRVLAQNDLTRNRLTSVVQIGPGCFARRSCMHCLEPSCVSACLVGALKKTPEGPVTYDPSKCIGCRYCMLACPFQIPRYEWDRTDPFIAKCDLCIDRLRQGDVPACVEACPSQALVFGEREELRRRARRRIELSRGRYLPRIWGDREFGGTSILYISDVDLSDLGWPEEKAPAIPHLTEPLISRTPHIGFGVFISLFGLNWIIRRRQCLMKEGELK